jgi:hypothetical protein
MTTLALSKLTGMSYDEIRALPQAVYEVLLEDLQARHAEAEALA